MKSVIGKEVIVTIDRPINSVHPKYKNVIYPLNYGYIGGVIAQDGDFQDAYILGEDKPLKSFKGVVIAVIVREDDVETKWVVAHKGEVFTKEEITKKTYFMERFFKSKIIL